MAGDGEMAELRALLEQQARTIEALEARLAAVEAPMATDRGAAHAAVSAVADGIGVGADADGPDLRTDRRGLLRQAGVAAAGVATGALVLGQASPAAAAPGTFDGNPAVQGTANPTSGIGVRGDTNIGAGVQGRATGASGYGVMGTNSSTTTSPNPVGVYGESAASTGRAVMGKVSGQTAVGLYGINDNVDATVDAAAVYGKTVGDGTIAIQGLSQAGIALSGFSSRAQLALLGNPPPPLVNAVFRRVGEVVFDTNQTAWICIAGGFPGTWRRLGGNNTAGALTLLPTPVRVYDSRPGNNPATPPKTKITGGTTRVLDTKNNSSGVPAGATGVLVTLTVVNGSANGGFLTLFSAGSPTPSTSSVNWSGSGQVVATTTVSATNTNAQVAVYCAPNSSTDLILDVIGYYQ